MTYRIEHLAEGVTLHLGDCMQVLPTLGHVSHVMSDPPFEEEAHTPMRRTQASIRSGEKAVLGFDAITSEQRIGLARWIRSNSDGWSLIFCQVEGVCPWRDALEHAGAKYKRAMAWVKPDSSPQFNGQGPAQGYEAIVAAWTGRGHSRWNGGGRRGVFTHCVNTDRQGEHPTEKPVSLMVELLGLFTDAGDLICDPFMGSGSTGVAAVKTGRRFVGIEMNERWFDLSCRRIEAALKAPGKYKRQRAAEGQHLLSFGEPA